jgi:hypothetical protein
MIEFQNMSAKPDILDFLHVELRSMLELRLFSTGALG